MTTRHCPSCWIVLPLSGEANCDCDGGTVVAAPAAQQTPRQAKTRPCPAQTEIDRSNPVPVEPPPDLAPPRDRTTTERLRELPDLAAHLALRLTTSRPGTEPTGTRRDPAETAPVHLAILHALDPRHRYAGDNMPAYLDDEAWRCPHATHSKDDCPWEADDDGRQGLLPDLAAWARMIHGDLEQYAPHLPDELPDRFTIANCCDWLARHHGRWMSLVAGPSPALSATSADQLRHAHTEMDRDVTRWHNRLRNELGERDPVTLRHTTAGGCGNIIEPRDGGTWYACTGCGEVFDHAAGLKRLAELQAPPTLAEASVATGISMTTLRRWVGDKSLLPINPGVRPARYRLRDVRAEAEREKRFRDATGRFVGRVD